MKGIKGTALTELGYDIRKAGALPTDPRGSHCGAGAPRFNVGIAGQLYFIGCNSPSPTVGPTSDGGTRLRWGSPLNAFQGFSPFGLVDITGLIAGRWSGGGRPAASRRSSAGHRGLRCPARVDRRETCDHLQYNRVSMPDTGRHPSVSARAAGEA